MKKLLFILILLASTRLFAQDSTKITNLSLQAKLVEYLAPSLADPQDDERFAIFIKWRASFRATKPTNSTAVITDTIGTVLLAKLYNQVLTGQEGMAAGALMKTQIASKRTANSYLNRLCTDYEQGWLASLIDRRQRGRRLLLGQ